MNRIPNVFRKTLRLGPHIKSFEIRALPTEGWMACTASDEAVSRTTLTDWHRVERMTTRFMLEIASLRRDGWIEALA